MKARHFPILAIGAILVAAPAVLKAQQAVGTAFTYQGRLKQAGQPVDATADFEFTLWDDPNSTDPSHQAGSMVPVNNKQIVKGLFAVVLDFGPDIFTGQARWLEIKVRSPAGGGPFVTLSPRQELTPAPHALALPGLWTQQDATCPNLMGGFSGNVVNVGVTGATVSGGGEAGMANRVTDGHGTVGGGRGNRAGDNDGDPNNARCAAVAGGQQNIASGWVATVGGGFSNSATTRATVSGGAENDATGGNSAVGGGVYNLASGSSAVIGGGGSNTASGSNATVAGGRNNQAINEDTTVGGGDGNTASGDNATVAGGYSNTASAQNATVAGGSGNTASGGYATVAGGVDNTAGWWATVGGGARNQAADEGDTVAGGEDNIANGYWSTVSGGLRNTADGGAVVAGGQDNSANFGGVVGGGSNNTASGLNAAVPGGEQNVAQGGYSFAAGRYNQALADYATISGGGPTSPSDPNSANRVTDILGTVGGGASNRAGSNDGDPANAPCATVGGGFYNHAEGPSATVAGGQQNTASVFYATVGGGKENTASGNYASIGGGDTNTASGSTSTVAGGSLNTASHSSSTVGGGGHNVASGRYSTVPGGAHNEATGEYSFAAGYRAKANHNGTFVWADSTSADFTSSWPDQFIIRAANGVGIGTRNPQAMLHVAGTAGVDGIMFPDGTLQTTAASGGGTGIYGSGTINYLPKFTATNTIGDSVIYETDGNVGVGTTTPSARLHVAGGDIQVDADGRLLVDAEGGRQIEMRYDPNTATGHLAASARHLDVSSGWTEKLTLRGGSYGIGFNVQTNAGNDSTKMRLTGAGNFGIGTESPGAKLHVAGTAGVDGIMFPDGTLQTTAATGGGGGLTLPYHGSVSSSDPAFWVDNTGSGDGVWCSASGDSAKGLYGWVTGTSAHGIYGEASGNSSTAVYGRATATGATTNRGGTFVADGETGEGVHGEASNNGDVINYGGWFAAAGRYGRGVYGSALGNDAYGVYAHATGSNGTGVYARSEMGKAIDALTTSASTNEWVPAIYGRNEGAGDGVYGWSQNRYGTVGITSSSNADHAGVWAKNNGAGPGLRAEAGSGGYAGVFEGWIKTHVVEITGGSDLSEQFDITAASGEVKPGMVVCIDPQNPGKLVVSSQAYDRKVAGVVSGAGGVGPGMLMGQKGSKADGTRPVALTGRVYCWVDASNGPIGAGDLLTTSDTPGHAMKVTDYSHAQGAVLGKAMTGLEKGETGLVLVLVSLQ